MEVTPDVLQTREYLEEIKRMLNQLSHQMDPLVEELYAGYLADRAIFLIGNGGSAAAASHFAQDLSKGTLANRAATKRLRAISLTDNVAWITALANDEGYESVFLQQLITLARPGDLLVAISGSGNSPNVLRAVEYANGHAMRTIGITGFDGGHLKPMAQVSVHVPSNDMGVVEAVHGVIFHLSVACLRERLAETSAVAS